MRILALDNEPLALGGLMEEIKKAQPECDIKGFTDPVEAQDVLGEKTWLPDVVFLDIEMPGMSGLMVAKSVKDVCPHCNIIFVTGYSEYAMDALQLHASGYLLKPVAAEDIRKELSDLRRPVSAPPPRVRIQTFGSFDIFVDGVPLVFARSKSKEALAYIVSRNGGSVTVAELAAVIWETSDYGRVLQNRTQTAISEMMKTLRRAGTADIIIKKHNSISLDASKADCDYYRFLRGDAAAVNAYMGEFMSNYSWAEMTAGYLTGKQQNSSVK